MSWVKSENYTEHKLGISLSKKPKMMPNGDVLKFEKDETAHLSDTATFTLIAAGTLAIILFAPS